MEVQKLGAITPLLLQLLVDLIAVGEAIHEFGIHSFLPEKWTPVYKRRKLVSRDLTRLADTVRHLIEPGIHQRRHGFLVRRGVLGFGEKVQRILVLVPVVAMKLRAQLFEGPLNERTFEHQSGQADVTRRL